MQVHKKIYTQYQNKIGIVHVCTHNYIMIYLSHDMAFLHTWWDTWSKMYFTNIPNVQVFLWEKLYVLISRNSLTCNSMFPYGSNFAYTFFISSICQPRLCVWTVECMCIRGEYSGCVSCLQCPEVWLWGKSTVHYFILDHVN